VAEIRAAVRQKVESLPNAPANAEFGTVYIHRINGKDCEFAVTGGVDTYNPFTAQLRNRYMAIVKIEVKGGEVTYIATEAAILK
jgi:hypothetical protein